MLYIELGAKNILGGCKRGEEGWAIRIGRARIGKRNLPKPINDPHLSLLPISPFEGRLNRTSRKSDMAKGNPGMQDRCYRGL
jgi:hypothetical protein